MGKVFIKRGVSPRALYIMAAVANVAQTLKHDVTITSGNDGKHMKGSRHYTDAALDVRSKNFPSRAAKIEFLKAVLARLGGSYEGFLEAEGTSNEHFHLEYDPR